MATAIISNGSKWGGGEPDGIEALFDVLSRESLDRRFEDSPRGPKFAFIDEEEGVTQFFGNFFTISHVFDVRTDDADLITRLTAAVHANQARTDYQTQQTPAERQAAEQAAWLAKRAREDEEERAAIERRLRTLNAAPVAEVA